MKIVETAELAPTCHAGCKLVETAEVAPTCHNFSAVETTEVARRTGERPWHRKPIVS
jgi:hypothetical protein